MAEGLVEGILGGEGEAEAAALEHPAPDAFAAALAHDAAKLDPAVAAEFPFVTPPQLFTIDEFGGWGEFRPLVANSGNGNTPANRRVEIYLTPLTVPLAPTGNPVDAAAGKKKATPAPVKGKAKSDDDAELDS